MNNTADGLQVYNNDIFSNLNTNPYTVGLILSSSSLSYNTQPFFDNNLILNQNPSGICTITTGTNAWSVSNNDFYGYTPLCTYTNPISGNPDFTSPPAGTGRSSASTAYTLTSSSPAFCQGASIPNNGSYDFNGVQLPSGAVDAGALEKGANIC